MSAHELTVPAPLAELILYAVPTGGLAVACAEYSSAVTRADRATTAQTYPPHCTLTGFFHRPEKRITVVEADLAAAIPEPTIRSDDVVATLTCTDDWVGLALESPRILDTIARLVDNHRSEPGEEVLRPKTWMHLSLAYDDGFDADWHAELAREVFNEIPPGDWVVGLWRRHPDGSWTS